MNLTTYQILNNSFLGEYIKQGYNEFKYSNGMFYIGKNLKFRKNSEIQPSTKELIELINTIIKNEKRKLNSINPLTTFRDDNIFISAAIHPNDNPYFKITIK